MGVDTECGLAIEADAAQVRVRETILRIRGDLIAEHLGVSPDRIASAVNEHGSLVRAVDSLNGISERQLAPSLDPEGICYIGSNTIR